MEEYIFYKISCCDPNVTEFYVGSTKNFTTRKSKHKACCNNENNKSKQYVFMRDHGGWDNWQMNPIDKQILPARIDARIHERKLTDEHQATLNTYRAYRSEEEKLAYNKASIRAYHKTDKYKAYHREKQKEYRAKKKLNSINNTENNIDA